MGTGGLMRTEYHLVFFSAKILALSFLIISPVNSQDPDQSIIDVNNITSWVGSNGFHDWRYGFPSHEKAGTDHFLKVRQVPFSVKDYYGEVKYLMKIRR
jgi:hypothetical protein